MREIIFRGKRIDTGEWVEGDLIQLHDGSRYIVNNLHGACFDAKGNFINTEEPYVCEVQSETVGQYTGLKDRNGVRIFEGDIVREHWSDRGIDRFGIKKHVVNMDEERCGWLPFACGDGCGCCETDTLQPGSCDVIGNEFEHAELAVDAIR